MTLLSDLIYALSPMIGFAALLSISLGMCAVLQGGINRYAAIKWGLTPVILLNNLVIFIAGIILFFLVKTKPAVFPSFFKSHGTFEFSWWYLLPGLLGLCLVAGIPFVISKIGALRVFVGIVAGQMILGMVWDYFAEGIPLSATRIAGALFALIGVVMLAFKN